VKLNGPRADGVPEITPPLDSDKLVGKAPVITDHVYGPVPPVAASVWLYGVPIVPLGRLVVVTTTGDVIVIVSGCGVLHENGVMVSQAVTLKLDNPGTVGVPEITPVVAFKPKLVGNEPEDDHVYGPVPPVAERVWW
jgi:hypothetical protein